MKYCHPSLGNLSLSFHRLGLSFSLGVFFSLLVSPSVWAQQNYLQSCNRQSSRCVAGLVCAALANSPTGICVHTCNPGDANTACPNGEPCNPQLAIPGACFCLSSADCQKGPCKNANCKCTNGQCVGDRKLGESCDDKNACGLGMKCSTVSSIGTQNKRCLKLCVAGSNGPVCANQMPCVAEGNHTVCKCSDDAHCQSTGPGYFCRNGACVNKLRVGEKCKQVGQCETGLRCVASDNTLTDKRCLPQCVTKSDCFGGEGCVRPGSVTLVCRCDSNNPCPSGRTCTNGLCSGFERCSVSKSCKSDYSCITPSTLRNQGVCVKNCKLDKDCSQESTKCVRVGTKQACYCRNDRDCVNNGKCINLTCTKGCKQSSDCPTPQVCQNGACKNPADGALSESPSSEGTRRDAGTRDQGSREPKPPSKCKEGCQVDQVCNETTGKCEVRLREIGEICEKAEVCKTKLCVENNNLKICTKKCTTPKDCQDVGLACRSAGGQQVCHAPDVVQPDRGSPVQQGCCQVDSQPAILPCLLLALFALLTFFRREHS